MLHFIFSKAMFLKSAIYSIKNEGLKQKGRSQNRPTLQIMTTPAVEKKDEVRP